jgi:hypothetical protein
MKKFAMTYATVNGLLSNADIRAISPAIQQAYESVNSQTSDSGCSACAKKKKMHFCRLTAEVGSKIMSFSLKKLST